MAIVTYDHSETDVIVLGPEKGRTYPCGSMTAVFKADGPETGSRYSVSEWWLEPHSTGPGAHSHESNEELFYVIDGTVSILTGTEWIDAVKGTLIRIPASVTHDFENRTSERAGLLNVFLPGGFEDNMPSIVDWFASQKQPT